MTDGRVISFGTRKPLIDEQKQAEAEKALDDAAEQDEAELHFTRMHEVLGNIVGMSDAGKMSSFVFMGRHENNGPFLTEFSLDPRKMSQFDIYSWIGAIEILKQELIDLAAMAPIMTGDGTVLDSAYSKYDGVPMFDEYDE